jgi:hypothetical protein
MTGNVVQQQTHARFGCVQWAAKKVKEGEDV